MFSVARVREKSLLPLYRKMSPGAVDSPSASRTYAAIVFRSLQTPILSTRTFGYAWKNNSTIQGYRNKNHKNFDSAKRVGKIK